jgi:hypothetical protein
MAIASFRKYGDLRIDPNLTQEAVHAAHQGLTR